MKIAVIGAGVIGVTTAYELSADGHEVTVFEQHQTAGEATSFANGGLIVPGWPAAFGATGGLGALLRPGGATGHGLRLHGWPGGGAWGWLWRWHRAQRAPQADVRLAAAFQLARYSQQRLADITEGHQLEYDRSQGVLLLWRHEREVTALRAALPRLREWGLTAREIDAAQARQIEPALNTETALLGAIELPGAQNANTRQFTLLLKNLAQQHGCRFEFGCAVDRIDATGAPGVRLSLRNTQEPARAFDQVVVCAGMASAALLRPLGLHLPLQPVLAHSVSAAVREPLDAPLSAVIDLRHHVSVARMGQRVRVAGGARLGGTGPQTARAELLRLYRVLMDWFPGAARLGGPKGSVQEWCGAQPTLPDGPPLVGQSPVPGVWINLGHGASGWAMACGSARALADHMRGQTPDIDMTSFAPTRLAG